MQDGSQNFQVGITTGKQDVLDPGQPLNVPVNPGGAPIFRSGRVVGGVGVAGVAPAQAEQAAFLASLSSAGLSPIPANPLPPPGAVFLDGIRLPFFANCISVNCVLSSLMQRPGAQARFRPLTCWSRPAMDRPRRRGT